MTEKLTKEDIDLLKTFFDKKIHGIIDEHKETPPYILELLIKEPTNFLGIQLNMFMGILMFILAYFATSDFSKNPSGLIYTLIIIGGFLFILYIVYNYLLEIGKKDDQWLLFKFMTGLKKGNKEANYIRKYLKDNGGE